MKKGPRIRRAIVVALAIPLLVRLAAIQGCFRPIRVRGDSMAPCLWGRCVELECPDCGFAYRLTETAFHQTPRPMCPNCGFDAAPPAATRRIPPKRLKVDRWPAWWGRLARFDLVAAADRHGRAIVKRLIGFPGESVRFRQGDVWIDGRRVEKTLRQFRSCAILVHDNRYRPSFTGSPVRWMPAAEPSRWTRWDRAWACSAPTMTTSRPARSAGRAGKPNVSEARLPERLPGSVWLEYRHRPDVSHLIPRRRRADEMPVYDTFPANGDLPRGTLHIVPDLVLDLDIDWDGRARLLLELRGQASRFQAIIDRTAGRVAAKAGSGPNGSLRSFALPDLGVALRTSRVLFGLVDGRFLVALDDVVLAEWPVEDPEAFGGSTRPFRIGLASGSVVLRRLRIWRDAYYVGPDPTAKRWESGRLDHPLLVGDNLPRSRDGRLRRAVPQRILGRVLAGLPPFDR